MKIAVPTVHMNGTSREGLVQPILTAMRAIERAEKAMGAVCPNGRDYYPQGDGAIQEALRQHANRLHNLRAVYTELEEIGEAISS